ncbi:nickel-dependent hydrogenase large subunit [Motiliproteus sp. SC1-56]|uniref:nickel-dependent hydrogenase large subunit n=1 Tax=Motiliproteus sp. SC1-56 TaxID=2799565 RepID=UPI001A8D97D8|nr:nickel-dependent hydrogenase large subunit [Motiliproteus sp. SC1-56]
MSRIVVGPFNRVEGDLEVKLDIDQGRVNQAWINCTLYRGFEQMLVGKSPRDALVYTPRICGICSVSQSVAAARALADLQQAEVPENGELAANLILANENLADHISHFYLFFMPDFARAVYAGEFWYARVAKRFQAVKGSAAAQVIPARAEFLHLMGILAGKWPHSLAIQPGGLSKGIQPQERLRLLAILKGFRRFLERVTFGDSLEAIAGLSSITDLERWAESRDSDLALFVRLAEALNLASLGRGGDRFMSFGNYPLDGQPTLAPGVWEGGLQALDRSRISEDVSHSWMAQNEVCLPPGRGETRPDLDKPDGYSWCKAPRLDGTVVEVGALARQVVDGQPLARALVAESGSNVRNRVVMRLVEVARTLMRMEGWAAALKPEQPCYRDPGQVPDGTGVGMIEAARGSLGHWIRVEQGRIANYQIIAPTTWNFSPRDQAGQPGALEQALAGTPVREGEQDPVAVQHVVRSFDPCMVCTVH